MPPLKMPRTPLLPTLHGVVQPARFAALAALVVAPTLLLAAGVLPFPAFALPALGLSLAAVLAVLVTTVPAAASLLATPWPTGLLVAGLAVVAALAPSPAVPLAPLALPAALLATALALHTTRHSWVHIHQVVLSLLLCLPWGTEGLAGNLMPAAGLLALTLTLLLGQPRLGGTAQLTLAAGLGVLAASTPLLWPLPLLVAIGVAAVWPTRALVIVLLALAACLATAAPGPAPLEALGTFFTSPWAPLARQDALTQLSAALLISVVGLQVLYHWRWWPAPLQAAWGLAAFLAAPTLAAATLPGAEAPALDVLLSPLSLVLPLGVYSLLKPNFKK